MATQLISSSCSSLLNHEIPSNASQFRNSFPESSISWCRKPIRNKGYQIRCSEQPIRAMRTCKNCKAQFDSLGNHPRACRYHTAHFGGETKRKFESVHSGGTMDTPGSGKVLQYWHCCGSEDPFDIGCTAAPHSSYDD